MKCEFTTICKLKRCGFEDDAENCHHRLLLTKDETNKKLHYGSKNYLREYAIRLLNRIINECKDLTPEQTQNERYELDGDLHSEIYNFLVNHNLLK